METLKAIFAIVGEKNCPLYKVGEQLLLTEKTFCCPKNKEVCLILVRDMTELLFQFMQQYPINFEKFSKKIFNCSGCRGLIKFALVDRQEEDTIAIKEISSAEIETNSLNIPPELYNSQFFKTLSPENISHLLQNLREIHLSKGSILIAKGVKNHNLYLVAEGRLSVEDSGMHLATLSTGEICGEMSYLGADVAVSTVQADINSRVFAISGEVFGKIMGASSTVQVFMAQLLASRLHQTNAARTQDFQSCMSGRIDEIVPAELFQIFHMHQKTGVLTMHFSSGSGKVAFREGCIINAEFGEFRNEEAIFKILGEKTGRYRFSTGLSPKDMRAAEIGDFMMLLMEGVKRVDEEQEKLAG